jgi:hypothetical protein
MIREINMLRPRYIFGTIGVICALSAADVIAQPPGRGPQGDNQQGPQGPPRDDDGGPPQGPPRRGRQGRPPNPLMEALDTNHDGILSAEEIANASASLKKLDKNGDGKLTPDELRPNRRPGGRRNGGRRGPDDGGPGPGGPGDRGPGGPGPDGPGRGFEGDRGGDPVGPGARSERPGRGDERGDRPGPDDGPPEEGRPGRRPGGSPFADRMVAHAMQFDADGDGKLNRDELMKFAQECARHAAAQGGPGRGRGPDDDGPIGPPRDDDRPGRADRPE